MSTIMKSSYIDTEAWNIHNNHETYGYNSENISTIFPKLSPYNYRNKYH